MRQSWVSKVHCAGEANQLEVIIRWTAPVILWMVDSPEIWHVDENDETYQVFEGGYREVRIITPSGVGFLRSMRPIQA